MSANVNKSWDDVCHRGEKLEQRAKFLKREMPPTLGRQISEAPPSNDNQVAKKWPDESDIGAIERVENAIDVQHAHVAKLMHERNAYPKNEALKQELDSAFAELERLEAQRAVLLEPYMVVTPPAFSEQELRIIEQAERMRAKYELEDSSQGR